MRHELVRLAQTIDWGWIDRELAECFSEQGRPALPTRFMVGLLLLKQTYGLSDEQVCDRWVHDPYFQYFTGTEFFAHEFPHERSGISHSRKRIDKKLDVLLAESLRVAHATDAMEHVRSGADHRRCHGAAEGRNASDRRQADAAGDPEARRAGEGPWSEAAAILCAARQAGGRWSGDTSTPSSSTEQSGS